jgi:DNA topoisomerase-1
VLSSYLNGGLVLEIKSEVESELRDELSGLLPEEAAVLAMLRTRLAQAVEAPLSGASATPAPRRRRRKQQGVGVMELSA